MAFVLEYSNGCSQILLFSLNMTHWLEGTASRLSQESPSFKKRECQGTKAAQACSLNRI
jgi:hypothetical protein